MFHTLLSQTFEKTIDIEKFETLSDIKTVLTYNETEKCIVLRNVLGVTRGGEYHPR